MTEGQITNIGARVALADGRYAWEVPVSAFSGFDALVTDVASELFRQRLSLPHIRTATYRPQGLSPPPCHHTWRGLGAGALPAGHERRVPYQRSRVCAAV